MTKQWDEAIVIVGTGWNQKIRKNQLHLILRQTKNTTEGRSFDWLRITQLQKYAN